MQKIKNNLTIESRKFLRGQSIFVSMSKKMQKYIKLTIQKNVKIIILNYDWPGNLINTERKNNVF